jgi:hypothetical protein
MESANQKPDREASGRRARREGWRWVVIRTLRLIVILIALAVMLVVIWQVIGGPAYLECMVSTIDAADCQLFGR